ncbi:MAG: hypothetical protein IK121_11720 [Lachnospiraceae bacterium]|nr:hypothetical protein [Lachnospiraceae bacterium]
MINRFKAISDYNIGYQKALMDVLNWFENHSITLKQNKMYNEKRIQQILKCLANNADALKDEGEDLELTVTNEGVIYEH